MTSDSYSVLHCRLHNKVSENHVWFCMFVTDPVRLSRIRTRSERIENFVSHTDTLTLMAPLRKWSAACYRVGEFT